MKSFVSGASDTPLLYSTIGEALNRTVSEYPNHEALRVCHQDVRWSYSELQARVEEVAAGLVALGLNPGDRVGIWSPNNAAWVQLKEGEQANADDIRDFCSGQIAKFKIPRFVDIVDALPMTVTGKIQRFIMRETMMRTLDLDGD